MKLKERNSLCHQESKLKDEIEKNCDKEGGN